jgi:hypothetical protein
MHAVYPCQKGSSAPLILDALSRAKNTTKWVTINYRYKRGSKSVKTTALHYAKKFPKFSFVGNVSRGLIYVKYFGAQ